MTSSTPNLSVTIPTMAGPSLASTSTVGEPSTPQAGPLPQKRGEIGFTEGLHVQLGGNRNRSQTRLPERHPEDRRGLSNEDGAATGHGTSAATTTTTANTTGATATNGAPGGSPRNVSPTDVSSTHSKRPFISFLKPKPTPLVAGLHGDTLLRFALQFGLIAITIAGWVGVAVTIAQHAAQQKSDAGSGDAFSTASGAASAFVHVAFSIAVLTQLLFLERVVYLLRAERYVHLHPGAILPRTFRLDRSRSRGSGNGATALAIAPWNRPPLPTYAAALRECGHGTGDVEDGAIAVPPPPAYGTTRGSTMLLSGFISNELRAQARAARPESQMSEASGARPVSYASRDGEWEERRDADRTRRVEEALGRLENGEGRSVGQERVRESDNNPPAAASARGEADDR